MISNAKLRAIAMYNKFILDSLYDITSWIQKD